LIIFSLVLYNNIDDFVQFISSHREIFVASNYSIVITDNSNGENQIKNRICIENNDNLNIHYIPSKTNLGYFGGARNNLKFINSKGLNFQWFIHCNTDIEIDAAFFLNIQEVPFSNIIYAPSIISTQTLLDQNPLYDFKPSRKWLSFILFITKYSFIFNVYRYLKNLLSFFLHRLRTKDKVICASKRKIYACHGSFICIGKEALKKGIKFKHSSFLFCEEISLAEECLSHNIRIGYFPESIVYHREHVSTGGNWRSSKLCSYHHESIKAIIKEYF